jgi:hypothetical protein
MSELDERVVTGLRELVDRAPVDADVWVETERLVQRHKHRRQTMVAAAIVAIVAAFTVAGVRSTASEDRVHVAGTTPETTSTTTSQMSSVPSGKVACPLSCIGQTTADVDGDSRLDKIGLFANPPLSGDAVGNSPSKIAVRVVFANGRVAEYHDTAKWDASLVGTADLNGDGRAEIFYFNNTGANLHSGYILRWDGSKLVAVLGSDGKPFQTFTSGYAMGGDGFRCGDHSYIAMTIQYGAPPDGWVASETTYRWEDNALVKVTDKQPMAITQPAAGATGEFTVPTEYDQIIGAHCPGMVKTYG